LFPLSLKKTRSLKKLVFLEMRLALHLEKKKDEREEKREGKGKCRLGCSYFFSAASAILFSSAAFCLALMISALLHERRQTK